MGARIYIATIGRFLTQDPDPGSLPNLYTYALDPINSSDLSGESLFGSIASAISKAVTIVAKTIAHVVAVVASTIVEVVKTDENYLRPSAQPTSTGSSTVSSKPTSSTKPVLAPITQAATQPAGSTRVNPLAIQEGPAVTLSALMESFSPVTAVEKLGVDCADGAATLGASPIEGSDETALAVPEVLGAATAI
jgi:hypothetical protein